MRARGSRRTSAAPRGATAGTDERGIGASSTEFRIKVRRGPAGTFLACEPVVYVSFDTDLALDPLAANITSEERANREAHYIKGTAHPDPGWTGKLSFAKQHDQGVVVLNAPATSKWPDIVPAQLPPVGFLSRNQGRLKNETFTLVGYGVDIGAKKAQIVIRERRSTTSFLKNVGSEVVTFQINDRDSKAGGGSCFGDSGGAAFWGPVCPGRRVCTSTP